MATAEPPKKAQSLAQLQAGLARFKRMQERAVRCPNCPGYIDPEQFTVVKLRKKNEDGTLVVGPDGQPRYTFARLPKHVLTPSHLVTAEG